MYREYTPAQFEYTMTEVSKSSYQEEYANISCSWDDNPWSVGHFNP